MLRGAVRLHTLATYLYRYILLYTLSSGIFIHWNLKMCGHRFSLLPDRVRKIHYTWKWNTNNKFMKRINMNWLFLLFIYLFYYICISLYCFSSFHFHFHLPWLHFQVLFQVSRRSVRRRALSGLKMRNGSVVSSFLSVGTNFSLSSFLQVVLNEVSLSIYR